MVNEKSKEEVYEAESKKITRYHDILEWFVGAFFLAGIVTASLNVDLGGFTPVMWFVLALVIILLIICMEVTMIRAFLESRKQK